MKIFLTCSAKFGRKVQYVNQLRELSLHMDLERLPIPKEVIEYVSRFFFMEVFMQHYYTWYRVSD
jgi:hypothetical protein